MGNGENNYKRILKVLRDSKPFLDRREKIEDEIINRIRRRNSETSLAYDFFKFLFGWIYIGWVRRSLVAVSVCLVLIFIYQQAAILSQVKKIGSLPGFVIKTEPVPDLYELPGNKLAIFRFSRQFSSTGEISISDRQVEQLIESYDKLQSQYSKLIRIIEEDPELKKYIDKKLNEEKTVKSGI